MFDKFCSLNVPTRGAASAANTRKSLSVALPAVAKAQAAMDSSCAFSLGAFLSHSTARASNKVAEPVRAVAQAQATLTPSRAENFVQDASADSTRQRQALRSCASPPQPNRARLCAQLASACGPYSGKDIQASSSRPLNLGSWRTLLQASRWPLPLESPPAPRANLVNAVATFTSFLTPFSA